MNLRVKGALDELVSDINSYRSDVNVTYSEFREKCRRAKERYNETTYENEKRKYANEALCQLNAHYSHLQIQWETFQRATLREELGKYVIKPVKPDLLSTLRLYREFNLTMSEAEFNAVLHEAADSYIGLRALAAISEGCGFRLTVPDVGEYEADIKQLDGLIDTAERYSPEGYGQENKELHRRFTKPVNQVWGDSPTSFAMSLAAVHGAEKSISAIAEKWEKAFVPTVTVEVKQGMTRTEVAEALKAANEQHEADKADGASVVKVQDISAERQAAEMGRRNAEADKRSKEILEHYTKG